MTTASFDICETITDKIQLTTMLQRLHWEEVARNKHLMVLDPALELYSRIEKSGALFAVMCRHGEKIVGYSVNILSRNLHYRSLIMCTNDVLFIAKEHRVGRTALRIIEATEREAAKRGARMMLWHAKEQTALAAILPRMGCSVQDIIYSKELAASNFQLCGTFDIAAARDEAIASDLWDVFTLRQDVAGSPHHDTRAIFLREPDAPILTTDIVFNTIGARDTVAVLDLPAVVELTREISTRLQIVELGRVMLVELAPGGHINLHTDCGAYAEHYERFHIALQSDEGNSFICDGEAMHMAPGQVWKFDRLKPHEVFNHSSTARIHLIIDATRE